MGLLGELEPKPKQGRGLEYPPVPLAALFPVVGFLRPMPTCGLNLFPCDLVNVAQASGSAGGAVMSPLGIGIAILFAVLMVSLFTWMFAVPPPAPLPVIKARHTVSALHHILVPVSADISSEGAAELACRLGSSQKAEITLVFVVEVPWTLSLNTPLPEEYARGEEALRTAEFIIKQHGLPAHRRSIPARYAWGGILNLAREESVDAIVMTVGHGDPSAPDGLGRTAREVIKRAQCEVILAKLPVRGGHPNAASQSIPSATQEHT
jgi:nucleotide-binding universal stress UspA family protein